MENEKGKDERSEKERKSKGREKIDSNTKSI